MENEVVLSFVCDTCGDVSDEEMACEGCGEQMEHTCSCGSGEPASKCCEDDDMVEDQYGEEDEEDDEDDEDDEEDEY